MSTLVPIILHGPTMLLLMLLSIICSSINDLRPVQIHPHIISQKFSVIPLSLTIFKDMIATRENNSYTNFETSWKPLENITYRYIFIMENFKCILFYCIYLWMLGTGISLINSSINLSQVHSFYDILSALSSHLIRTVLKATNIFLKRIGLLLRKLSDILFLLIILENPFLFQRIYRDESNNIIKHTFSYISSLSNEIHRYIINWLYSYDTNILYKKIQLCNSFIFRRLYKYTQRLSARMITLLLTSNNQKTSFFLSEFYNTMVDYIDLVADFDTWE
ncbi:hypothetical protein PNEG_00554 [Pneumocystis murina B123]|uniref:Uncharacterized protein n=1 Tax=Pneumocystis murina (strain B123) TaxID=1069680 RepID=M7NWL6_PNEMU|nr:hypothetical protein PNEG_00554 [Pneumocystis murina B123]EMR11546.1 hypothetical protein PNEG_00554 [Pneumocystis murina B123]